MQKNSMVGAMGSKVGAMWERCGSEVGAKWSLLATFKANGSFVKPLDQQLSRKVSHRGEPRHWRGGSANNANSQRVLHHQRGVGANGGRGYNDNS